MKREDIAIVGMWIAIIFAVVLGVKYGVVTALIEAIDDTLVALIGGAVVLIGGILTHALTQLREQRLEQQREMQRNYARLLESIDKVIRDPEVSSDVFAKVHLQSWVVGSEEVIRKTQMLMKAPDQAVRKEALQNLVYAMRKDVGLPHVKGLELWGIFLEPKKEGYLSDTLT